MLLLIFLPDLSKSIPRPWDTLRSEMVRLGEDSIAQPLASRTEFWFFKESDAVPYIGELIEWLLVTEPFAKYPRLLIDKNGEFDGSKAGIPSLVFVFLGSNIEVKLMDVE